MRALLIDVGSTFIKYSVYEKDKGLVFFEKTPFPQPIINDQTRFVVSREELCGKILALFDSAEQYGCEVAIFSVQMHGYVARFHDGSLSEYVSWRDKSGDTAQKKFEGVNFNSFGLSLSSNLPVTKLDGSTVKEFYTLGSFLSYTLTGNNATHLTDAFASGFYYSPSGKPNDFACGMTMPEALTSISVVGEYKGIKILCPFGDHQISFLGSGAGDKSYMINIGTGAQACCIDSFDHADGKYQKRPYFDSKSCLYSFCGLHGIDGNLRDQEHFISRVTEAIALLPKKQSAFVGGGGGDQVFDQIKQELEKMGVCSFKEDFNVGTQGLIAIADQYFDQKN